MCDGSLERTLHGCLFRIYMNPLVVECCVGKKVDALLCKFHIVGDAKIFAEHGGKILIVVYY